MLNSSRSKIDLKIVISKTALHIAPKTGGDLQELLTSPHTALRISYLTLRVKQSGVLHVSGSEDSSVG